MEAELFDTEGELKVIRDWLTGIGEGMAKVSKLNVCRKGLCLYSTDLL